MPEFIDPVFGKTRPKRSFSVMQNEHFGLVFAKTGSINSGTVVSYFHGMFDNIKQEKSRFVYAENSEIPKNFTKDVSSESRYSGTGRILGSFQYNLQHFNRSISHYNSSKCHAKSYSNVSKSQTKNLKANNTSKKTRFNMQNST